jgi:FAD/FMN-containing dehydrogenase
MKTSQTAHSIVLDESTLAKFKSGLRGELLDPRDVGYDEARKVWNGMIDKHPALIARCADADDVVQAVQFARSHDLQIAVRGGGHNVAGFGTCQDGIVIDLSPMKKIEVDSQAQIARAQGGLTWGEFDKATQQHALATTGGLVSTTGIAGFTTGGGIGWLMRKHGLALDNLLSVEMVLADGRCVTANQKENSDLFWGLRGGGGNFGIVTEFTYHLHRVGPTIFGGALFHPLERAEELLKFYREWTLTLPDELTTMVAFLTAPPAPFVPASLQGTKMIAMAMCHCGALEEGDELVRPLREFAPPAIDLLGPHPYLGLQTMFDASAPRGMYAYWKTEYLNKLDDGLIEGLVEDAGMMASPLSAIHIHHVQGVVSRMDAEATAFSNRDEPFILNIIGGWMDPTESDSHIAWVREAWQAVQPYSTGETYLNFLGDEGEARIQAAYGAKKYQRLVELKNKYDPTNLFSLNQNIKPK